MYLFGSKCQWWSLMTEQKYAWLMHRHGKDFSVGWGKLVKNNQDNQIQSIPLCNMYFSKKVYAVYNGVWGKAPEAGEFSRIFVLESNLTVCKVTF